MILKSTEFKFIIFLFFNLNFLSAQYEDFTFKLESEQSPEKNIKYKVEILIKQEGDFLKLAIINLNYKEIISCKNKPEQSAQMENETTIITKNLKGIKPHLKSYTKIYLENIDYVSEDDEYEFNNTFYTQEYEILKKLIPLAKHATKWNRETYTITLKICDGKPYF